MSFVADAVGVSNMGLPVLSVTALDIALRIVILDVYMYYRCIVYTVIYSDTGQLTLNRNLRFWAARNFGFNHSLSYLVIIHSFTLVYSKQQQSCR